MELKDNEFQKLRLKVDQISSELDKQNTIRVVNTKWLITIGALILASLGFTSFVQLPREAARQAEKQVGIEIPKKANDILLDLRGKQNNAKAIEEELTKISELDKIANLPISTIIPSMLDPEKFAEAVGDPSEFDSKISQWVLADGQKDITNSRYAQLSSKTKTPDLRSRFLRGMYEGREVGSYQEDALRDHGHNTDALKLRRWINADTKELGYTSKGGADSGPASVKEVKNEKNVNVDDETRPKNVAVYFYIKIN